MNDALPWAAWLSALERPLTESRALCVGLFTRAGQALALNAGMRALVGEERRPASLAPRLVSPTLDALRAAAPSESIIYRGWLTFWEPGVPERSVRGEVRRLDDAWLIVAEHDVEQLERINREIADLNGQVVTLERELARKNAALEQALAELRETQAMLIHSEKMNALGQLVAGVAHEINNPLSYVNGNLHTLRTTLADLRDAYLRLEAAVAAENSAALQATARALRQELDLDFILDDLDDLLSGATDGLERIRKIVDSLRTFARLDEAEYKEVDLIEAIRHTLVVAQPALRDRVQVVFDCEPLPPWPCYAAEMNQVFLNLIVNAAQAMPDGGTLTIRGRQEGDVVVLEFSDTGCGMTPEVLARAFDPFFTTKPVGAGTGLGLTIAYKIVVDHHQGSIRATSTPGVGSTFTITLPRKDQP